MSYDANYDEFPCITIGGPTGDYFAECPVPSAEFAEYAVDSVVNGDVGTSAIVISGNAIPTALSYAGLAANTFTDNAVLHSWPIRIPLTTTLHVNSSWDRVINSQRRVYVRIDAGASNSVYVTLRFRIKRLKNIPAPAHTVHPDHMQQINQARAETTNQRIEEMGLPDYAHQSDQDITHTVEDPQPFAHPTPISYSGKTMSQMHSGQAPRKGNRQ